MSQGEPMEKCIFVFQLDEYVKDKNYYNRWLNIANNIINNFTNLDFDLVFQFSHWDCGVKVSGKNMEKIENILNDMIKVFNDI